MRDFDEEFDVDKMDMVVTSKELENFCKGPKEINIRAYRGIMAVLFSMLLIWVIVSELEKGWEGMRMFLMLPYWQLIEVVIYFWLAYQISQTDDQNERYNEVDPLGMGTPRYLDEPPIVAFEEQVEIEEPHVAEEAEAIPQLLMELPEDDWSTQCWIHMNIAYPISFLVMILFWGVIFQGSDPTFTDIACNGIPFVFVAIDVFFSGIPFRYLHVWLPMYYLFLYFSVTIVFAYVSGSKVYDIMDYNRYPALLLLPIFVILVAVPAFQVLLWLYKRAGLKSTGLGGRIA